MTRAYTMHPFEVPAASSRFGKPSNLLLLVAASLLMAAPGVVMGFIGMGACLALIAFLVYAFFLFRKPIVGLYSAVILSFLLIGAGRYIPNVQVGLGLDAILILTYLALFLNRFHMGVNWSPARKDITWLALAWMAYSVFQVFNPEASSLSAWFSGRGIGIYFFLLVPLALVFLDRPGKLRTFLVIWGLLSLLASLKGIMQVKFGVDAWERGWLDAGNFKTHILFGKLRAFSFLSDAGQFGANQGYSAVVAFVVSLAYKGWKTRTFFLVVFALAMYGLVISGTRGALSVPLAGFGLFVVLRKNLVAISIGVALLAGVLYFFMGTTIGQGNADIRRMRTAFDSNDASLQVRLNNQNILKSYMATRPFGGGIGHGGVKAQRFLPNAYLSQIPTDSWYVLIWVEQGIVGLILHLAILFYVLAKSCYKIMFRMRDPQLKLVMTGLASGMFGIMVASYGNAVLGQMPTNVLLYISMAVLSNSDWLDRAALTISSITTNP